MKETMTQRGFRKVTFEDIGGVPCSLQESSNVEPCIWLGADKVTVYDERRLVVDNFQEKTGFLIAGRMLLDPSLARQVAMRLLQWADSVDYVTAEDINEVGTE